MSNPQQHPAAAFAYPIGSYHAPTPVPAPAGTTVAQTSQATSTITTTTIQPQNAGAGPSSNQAQSRQAAEEARKDRTLAEFLLMLDEYEPLVSSQRALRVSVTNSIRFPTRLRIITSSV